MGEGNVLTVNGVNAFFVRGLTFENVATGIVSGSSNIIIEDCLFRNNHGGAMHCSGDCRTAIRGSRFVANSSVRGGAIYLKNTSYAGIARLEIENCIFEGNHASFKAGAIYLTGESGVGAKIINSTFFGNTAEVNAGAVMSKETATTIENTIFWGNQSPRNPSLFTGTGTSIRHCDIEVDYPGLGNIRIDPEFAEVGYVSDNNTPDDPQDDLWVEGNYRLQSEGGRWLSDRAEWASDDVTSPCIDTGNPGYPLGAEANSPRNIRINMGAYGGTSEASRSPAQWHRLSDIGNDGAVNNIDLTVMVESWLNNAFCLPADLNRDGSIDMFDFARMAKEWLNVSSIFAE
jgi:hypothetical protein